VGKRFTACSGSSDPDAQPGPWIIITSSSCKAMRMATRVHNVIVNVDFIVVLQASNLCLSERQFQYDLETPNAEATMLTIHPKGLLATTEGVFQLGTPAVRLLAPPDDTNSCILLICRFFGRAVRL